MADRKKWELTDREVFDSWRPDAPLEASQRSIATAAARKALEWAAKSADVAQGVGCDYCRSASAIIRKELPDG